MDGWIERDRKSEEEEERTRKGEIKRERLGRE